MDELDNYNYFVEEMQMTGITACMSLLFLFGIMNKLVTVWFQSQKVEVQSEHNKGKGVLLRLLKMKKDMG